jgi:hypothetical protein
VAEKGARLSGRSPKPATLALVAARAPVMVMVWGGVLDCPKTLVQHRAAAAARVVVVKVLIVFPGDEQVGKHGQAGRRCLQFEPASLREDYLNQVQRDFLSRPSHDGQHP